MTILDRRRLVHLVGSAVILSMTGLPAALGASGASAAQADSGCASVHPGVSAKPWQNVGQGIRRRDVTVATTHGSVTLHEVDGDLSSGAKVSQTATNATSSAAMITTSVQRLGGVAGVNGDFFHVTTDGSGLSADGNVGTATGPIKGYAAESPAISLVNGGVSVGYTHLSGTLVISQPPPAAASNAAHVQTVTAESGTTKPVAKKPVAKKPAAKRPATKKPAKKVVTKAKHKPAKYKKSKHKKAKKKVVRKRIGIYTPVAAAPVGTAGPLPAAGSAAAAPPVVTVNASGQKIGYIPLTAMNDDEALGSVLYSSSWGGSDRSAGVPASSLEIGLAKGVVTYVKTGSGSSAPALGSQALVLSGAAASALNWVRPGDTVTGAPTLIDRSGSTVGVSVSGDAILVSGGNVSDPECSLDNDTSVRPRVVAGTDSGDQHLLILVDDGDVPNEAGLTVREAAEVAASLGLAGAVNFDGGNSSQLILKSGNSYTQINRNSQSPQRAIPDGLVLGN